MKVAAAYVRRSHVELGDPGAISEAGQEDAIRRLAQRDDIDPDSLRWFRDWGLSADPALEHKRTEYVAMLKAIEAGEVSVVYALAPDRLYRSLVGYARLVAAAVKAGTRIVTELGGPLVTQTPDGEFSGGLGALLAARELSMAKDRARRGIATKRRLGIPMGQMPYGVKPGEDVEVLRLAFVEAGSFLGAVKLLNARGVPSRLGRGWDYRTLSRILRAHGYVGASVRRGAAAGPATRALAGLVLCHCGAVMTSMSGRLGGVNYYCRQGHNDSRHARPYVVADSMLLPWIKAEVERGMGRMHLEFEDEVLSGGEDRAERDDLTARRERLKEAYLDLHFDHAALDALLAPIDDRLAALGDDGSVRRWLVASPALDWSAPASEVNAALRRIGRSVQLDAGMRPIAFDWIVSADDRALAAARIEAAADAYLVAGRPAARAARAAALEAIPSL